MRFAGCLREPGEPFAIALFAGTDRQPAKMLAQSFANQGRPISFGFSRYAVGGL
jgi:hypothetical protein